MLLKSYPIVNHEYVFGVSMTVGWEDWIWYRWKNWLIIFTYDFWSLIQEVDSKKLFSRFRCQYARTFHYWTLGTRKWSYLRWVSMMDRECCSTSCPISSDPRQLASTLSTCNSTRQIAAAWCTGTCLHVGFIWWHRARPRVTLLISSQVDKKKILIVAN